MAEQKKFNMDLFFKLQKDGLIVGQDQRLLMDLNGLSDVRGFNLTLADIEASQVASQQGGSPDKNRGLFAGLKQLLTRGSN